MPPEPGTTTLNRKLRSARLISSRSSLLTGWPPRSRCASYFARLGRDREGLWALAAGSCCPPVGQHDQRAGLVGGNGAVRVSLLPPRTAAQRHGAAAWQR